MGKNHGAGKRNKEHPGICAAQMPPISGLHQKTREGAPDEPFHNFEASKSVARRTGTT